MQAKLHRLAAQPADFAQTDAVTVMDPFHVVALAGTKLDQIRQRIQQQTLGRRGHSGDPLMGSGASPAPDCGSSPRANTPG
jgi:hypothetical protein